MMKSRLFKWSPAVSAMPRILSHAKIMEGMSYIDKLQWYNKIMGPDWIFRLKDVVGLDLIKKNRKSWADCYVNDMYDLHMPLDPRAPETDKMLGKNTGTKEFAFYSGMGFDGYVLALNTLRKVNRERFEIDFDNLKFDWISKKEILETEKIYEADGTISKETYYRFYGEALLSIFNAIKTIVSSENIDEEKLENTAASSLLFLCGGHQGYQGGSQYISNAERSEAQLDVIIISLYCRSLTRMDVMLDDVLKKKNDVIELIKRKA